MIWILAVFAVIVVLFVCARIGAMLADEAGAHCDAGPAPKCPAATVKQSDLPEYGHREWCIDMTGVDPGENTMVQ